MHRYKASKNIAHVIGPKKIRYKLQNNGKNRYINN